MSDDFDLPTLYAEPEVDQDVDRGAKPERLRRRGGTLDVRRARAERFQKQEQMVKNGSEGTDLEASGGQEYLFSGFASGVGMGDLGKKKGGLFKKLWKIHRTLSPVGLTMKLMRRRRRGGGGGDPAEEVPAADQTLPLPSSAAVTAPLAPAPDMPSAAQPQYLPPPRSRAYDQDDDAPPPLEDEPAPNRRAPDETEVLPDRQEAKPELEPGPAARPRNDETDTDAPPPLEDEVPPLDMEGLGRHRLGANPFAFLKAPIRAAKAALIERLAPGSTAPPPPPARSMTERLESVPWKWVGAGGALLLAIALALRAAGGKPGRRRRR